MYFRPRSIWKKHAIAKNCKVCASSALFSSRFSSGVLLELLPQGAQFGEANNV
jgi:hypothetical protein